MNHNAPEYEKVVPIDEIISHFYTFETYYECNICHKRPKISRKCKYNLRSHLKNVHNKE